MIEKQVNAGVTSFAALKHCSKCGSVDLTETIEAECEEVTRADEHSEPELCGQPFEAHSDDKTKHRIRSHEFFPAPLYRCEFCGRSGNKEHVIADDRATQSQ